LHWQESFRRTSLLSSFFFFLQTVIKQQNLAETLFCPAVFSHAVLTSRTALSVHYYNALPLDCKREFSICSCSGLCTFLRVTSTRLRGVMSTSVVWIGSFARSM